MSDLEELLRAAMRDHTEQLVTSPGIARQAIRRATRVRRAHYAATATVAALGTTAAVGVLTHNTAHHTTTSGPGRCYDTNSPSSASASDADPTAPTPSSTPAVAASAALKAVRVPDPAPGFPIRRAPDAVSLNTFTNATDWSAIFLLGETPPTVSSLGANVTEATPTGPEATVIVADGQPYDLASPTSIENVPVIETTKVAGELAYVTATCDQTDVFFSTGEFQVDVGGFGGATLGELVTLGNSIEGLQ